MRKVRGVKANFTFRKKPLENGNLSRARFQSLEFDLTSTPVSDEVENLRQHRLHEDEEEKTADPDLGFLALHMDSSDSNLPLVIEVSKSQKHVGVQVPNVRSKSMSHEEKENDCESADCDYFYTSSSSDSDDFEHEGTHALAKALIGPDCQVGNYWREFLKKASGRVFSRAPEIDYNNEYAPVSSLRPLELARLTRFNRFFLAYPRHEAFYFQEHFLEFFKTLFPGLQQVLLEQKDVCSLIVFGILFALESNSHEILTHPLLDALFEVHENFYSQSGVIKHFLETYKFAPVIEAKKAWELLLRLAMEESCVYTVEAFFVTGKVRFHQDALLKSVQAFAVSNDWRIFRRISSNLVYFNRVQVSLAAAKHCAMGIFEEFFAEIRQESSFAEVAALKEAMQSESILTYLAAHKCHSPNLLNFPEWTEEDFDSAALECIRTGNWKLFKLFMADSRHSLPSMRPNLLSLTKIIYSDDENAVELFKAEFSKLKREFQGANELVSLTIQLGSPEKTPLSIFKWILKERDVHLESIKLSGGFDALSRALFIEDLEYLRVIVADSSRHPTKLVAKSSRFGHMGLWEWIKGSKRYSELMHILVSSKTFDVRHAFANPNLDHSHWDSLLPEGYATTSAYRLSLAELSDTFGFDEEILNYDDRNELNLNGKKDWTLLHLAVVAFNVRAVEALVMRGLSAQAIFSPSDRRTPLLLAQQILQKIQAPSYLHTYQMPQALEKVQLRRELRAQFPDFYAEKPELVSVIQIRNRAVSNCEAIINILTGNPFTKSMSSIQDYDL